ncbi:hypothetical protein ACFW2V_13510 [Streptomyces sp. NPDC058947]|uniref:hypothetical protein n=1 Tax=Streptomyces sp. NPDC058947 TaxID=3346675 RepID=UPI0036A8EABA
MSKYPKARWTPGKDKVGASVWTQKVPEEGGGGYYLYGWERGTGHVVLEELVQASSKEERQWPIGKSSTYAWVGEISVPHSVHDLDWPDQEIEVARLIYMDMRKRFPEIAEWITYDTFGDPVRFHEEVVGK